MSNNNFEANPHFLPQKRTFGELNNPNMIAPEPNMANIESSSPMNIEDESLEQIMMRTPALIKKPESRDRFIPSRGTSLYDDGLFARPVATTSHAQYVTDCLLGATPRKILSYANASSPKQEYSDSQIHLSFSERITGVVKSECIRYKPAPAYKFRKYKVLDAIGLHSDFYFHLLSCSRTNRLFTSLKNGMNEFLIYSCTPESTGSISIYQSAPVPYGMTACSVKAFGNVDVVTGWSTGNLMIHTVEEARIKPKKNMMLLDKTLNCLEVVGENQLWVGSKTGWLNGYDIRQAKVTFRFETNTDVSLPKDTLVGMAFNNEHLMAVGTNSGTVKVWDVRRPGGRPYSTDALHNESGIKALAFNPYDRNELVSGGGSTCKHLVLRNISIQDTVPQKTNMGCQVTGVAWLEKKDHLVASTGFSAQLGLFRKHKTGLEALTNTSLLSDIAPGRMVYLAAHQNECVVTYDGDETLNYFSIDGLQNKSHSVQRGHQNSPGLLQSTGPFTIR